MLPLVDPNIDARRLSAFGLLHNHHFAPVCQKVLFEQICIECFVCQEFLQIDFIKQPLYALQVMSPTTQCNDSHKITKGIGKCQDLCSQAATTASDGLARRPSLAACPCRCPHNRCVHIVRLANERIEQLLKYIGVESVSKPF